MPRGRFVDPWSAGGSLPVSVLCSLHPDGLAEALEGTAEGLAARFLFAWPSPLAHRALAGDTPSRENDAVIMLHRLAGAVGTPDRPLALAFDEEALKRLDPFLTRLHEETSGSEGAEAAWLGKGRGTVVRLAAILALLDWSRHVPPVKLPRTVRRDHCRGGGPPVAGLLPAPCPRGARALGAVGFRAPGAPRRPLAEGRCQGRGHARGGEAPGPGQDRECGANGPGAGAAAGRLHRAAGGP